MKHVILLPLLFLSLALHALTISSGNTYYTYNNQLLDEDIIVEGGGSLVISGNLYFDVNSSTGGSCKIHIEDGGSVYSSSGSISGGGLSLVWTGFILDPTDASNPNTNFALKLNNFTVMGAKKGIHIGVLAPDEFNQKILISNSEFIDNHSWHMQIGTYAVNNRDNSPNSVVFAYCTFGDVFTSGANYNSPIHVNGLNNLVFDHCTFDYNDSYSDVGIHFSQCRDVQINNNDFQKTGHVGLAIHGMSLDYACHNVEIMNNTFSPADELGIYYAIAVGCTIMMGQVEGLTVHGNSFNSPATYNHYTALCIGNDDKNGMSNNMTVSDNDFNDFEIGIESSEVMGNSEVSDNSFNGYENAILITGDNLATEVTCNRFYGPGKDIVLDIDGMLYNGFGSYSGTDFHNKHYTSFPIHIENNNYSFAYNYNQSASNAYPAVNLSGNVFGLSVIAIKSCLGPPDHKRDETTMVETTTALTIYPNPATDNLIISDLSAGGMIKLQNSLGQTVFEIPITGMEDQLSMDISMLETGIYFISVTDQYGAPLASESILKQ